MVAFSCVWGEELPQSSNRSLLLVAQVRRPWSLLLARMADSARASTMMQWIRSTPEGKKQQVDTALEYAVEATLGERPAKPLLMVAAKLREWDAAVNAEWPLRREAEAVFSRADVDSSGSLDMSEISAMRQDPKFAELMLNNLDTDLSGKVSLAEWLLAMKANADKSEESTKAMLQLYDDYLSGKSKPAKRGSRRDLAM